MLVLAANIVFYKITWIACLTGAAASSAWSGPAVLALFLVAHFAMTRRYLSDSLLVVAAAGVGVAVDSSFAAANILTYSASEPAIVLAPVWIVAMWMNFALTLNHGFARFGERPQAAALLGLIGGPLAYLAGTRLGAASFGDTWLSLAVIGLTWAAVTPALYWLARRLAELESRRVPAVAA